MKTAPVILPAMPADAAEIARIYNHYVDAGGSTFDTQHWEVAQTAAQLPQHDPEGWFVAKTAAQDEPILGWASVRRFSARFGYRFSCESAIYVDSQAMGTGAANALQAQIESHCVRNRIHHAVARIVADNARSMAFHRRWGYELVGIQKEIGHMDDQWIDVAILQKIFTTPDDHNLT
ncbi:MAG: N-acetyltransferase family protein [Pirellulales bacterium]|nr:N-acetyltransferase family protein [Pirellulales bacterium]